MRMWWAQQGWASKVARISCLLLGLAWGMVAFPAASAAGGVVPMLTIDGPIGPATAQYIEHGLGAAASQRAPFILIRIDTPGGLETSMHEIVQGILASPLPVVGYVAPGGARAASAGTYILYACHVAAMAPGTHLGAATPVAIGIPGLPGSGEPSPAEKKGGQPASEAKAVNDAVALIRSLAELRHRNADWAETAVRQAASLSASEALKARVIDLIAADLPDLLRQLDGRPVAMASEDIALHTANLTVTPLTPDWRTRVLAVITNPNVATILLLIGLYGIVFEFLSPGFFAPGVIGAICLLVAFYALHLMPIDATGVALFGLGIGLMVAEAFTPGFGVLGLGGIIAFVLGSMMLVDTDAPGFGLAWPLVGGTAVSMGAVVLGIAALVARSRRHPVRTGSNELLGSDGVVVDWQGYNGRIRVNGILWQAHATRPLATGTPVRVTAVEGLTLTVDPWDHGS